MDFISKYQEFSNQVDLCEDEERLTTMRKEMSATAMRAEFIKQRSICLNSPDSLERKKAFLKQQWIQQFFGCSIPIKRSIRVFKAPNGLFGITIDPKAAIGDNCTIFQQVYIGVDTNFDSENHGLPVIGSHVSIGPGVKIIGNVVIGDNVRIDANCYITQDIPANSHVKNNSNALTIVHKENIDTTYISTKKYLDTYFEADRYECKDTDKIEVSKAEPSDIEVIIKMYKDRVNWFKWKNVPQWSFYLVHHPREEFVESIQKGNYYIVKLDGKIIAGFVISTESESWEDPTSNAYYLSRAIIHTSYKNVGPFIVEYAKNIAISEGKDSIRLECVFSNESLNNLWEKLGFTFVRDVELSYHASLRELKLYEDTYDEIVNTGEEHERTDT